MSYIIDTIQNLFLKEALSSPLLFKDLASMEKYISESYTGRSLIELLQNADDAGAKRFLIKALSISTYMVANDGREFSDNDILALCRSGSSTKQRKGNTIGFRGIGFKSVVNYAETVHLVSGDIKTTFSRNLTKKVIPEANEVPMIRIPHRFSGESYYPIINDLQSQGYKTVFIFEVKNHSLSEEVKCFNSDSMIFLQSIVTVEFHIDNKKSYSINREQLNNTFLLVQAESDSDSSAWLVTPFTKDTGKSAVAFKYDGNRIIAANNKEAVVHSFMPTLNSLSMPIKINGDFSTDPSRTKVVLDEDTNSATKQCANILSHLVESILVDGTDDFGIVNVIKKAQIDPLFQIKGKDINDVLVEQLFKNLKAVVCDIYGSEKEVFLQPIGMTDADFDKISVALAIKGAGKKDEKKIQGLTDLLSSLGYKEIPLEQCLDAMKIIECSAKTRECVLVKAINQSRFGMSERMAQKIAEAKLISFNSGVVSSADLEGNEVVNAAFEGAVIESLATPADYTAFTKIIGLKTEQLAMNQPIENGVVHSLASSNVETQRETFSKNRVINKWRSVEMNVAAVLEQMDGVSSVIDVSTQNMGYDIEVGLVDGRKRYYEVKSVSCLGDVFSFSNNEYTTAMQYKKSYYLAIACQTDSQITICFISDPINTLAMTKRVTRWEWICNEYSGEVVTADME